MASQANTNVIVLTSADGGNTIFTDHRWIDAIYWTGAASTNDLVLSDVAGTKLYQAINAGADLPIRIKVRARGLVATTIDGGTVLVYLRERSG